MENSVRQVIQYILDTHRGLSPQLSLQTIHDDERNRMKIVILGDAAATADVLQLLDSVLGAGNDLLGGAVHNG